MANEFTPRFVCDAHMGGAARYLRMLGFDAVYDPAAGDDELAAVATTTGRILLSKDKQLLARLPPELACRVMATAPKAQLAEVLDRFDLRTAAAPLTRCLACNDLLRELPREKAQGRVPEGALALHDDFRECPRCGRVYWEGSHFQRMRTYVESVLR